MIKSIMFSRFITKTYNSKIRHNANKNKELLSVNKNSCHKNLLNKSPSNKPKYTKNERIMKLYARPFDLQKFSMVHKRNYYANPQKPPEDDYFLYIMICCAFLTYRYIQPPPPPSRPPSSII